MKKLLFICCIFLFLLSSCDMNGIINDDASKEADDVSDETSGESDENITIHFDTDGASVTYQDYVQKKNKKLEIDISKFIPSKDNCEFLGWSLNKIDLFDPETILTNDVTIYAMWEDYNKDYQYLIEEYIPDVIDGNIELPEMHEKLHLIWSTSNQNILDNYGNLTKPHEDTKLTVYLEVYYNGYSNYCEKEVLIKKVELKTLVPGHTVFGYYSTWNFFGYTEEMMKTLDVVNLCFGYVDVNGNLDYSSVVNLLPQVMNAHNYGVRVVLSVQGYSSAGEFFSNAASTAEGRKKLANSMLEFIEKYNLDGIDIDWEYPGFNTGRSTSVDRANYTLLIKEIRETLKAKSNDYLITAAIPGGPYTPSRFDLTSLNNYLDYFHVMTYDLNASGTCVHHTALYDGNGTVSGCSVDASVNYYLNQGVDRNKIVPGLAFYGKYTSGSSLRGSGGNYKSVIYTTIVEKYLSRLGNGVEYYFDNECKAPYLIDTENNIFITYDDERSIKEKCEYTLNNNLGGVMIWEVGEDKTLNLLNQIYNTMKKELGN